METDFSSAGTPEQADNAAANAINAFAQGLSQQTCMRLLEHDHLLNREAFDRIALQHTRGRQGD